ncbi:MAG: exodeoxyribonuclease VII small subunit [Clostridiaceae bacterium]|jgi:exodeoxyribonuclease VII small subunit|nr:exodeoxyribonuclease VII small subunit [Oscillospiraceae bacterium]NLO62686.1 exodeoxyribonuclease VII small subunit [Clostridiaceae bacterium]
MDSENYNELSYEEAVSELEAIIRKLENGQVGLEESLELYKNGTLLARICGDKLAEAERQIMILSKSADGNVSEQSFDVNDDEKVIQ